ncbi:MAG: hypothetical protein Q4B69_02215 [Slackia sp.]|nr:hypothetical protein [Slackia sp.]
MSKPMDHIAYLSQEIGPRPAGTEEEQQAALYITDRFQKETGLSVAIEDFTCSSDASMPELICYIVTIVAVLLGLFLPVAVIPAVLASVLSAAVFVAERFDKPLLSQLFMKGVSQNVVAKYEPAHDPDGAGPRRRKVIVVANYDSGKVRHDLSGFLPSIRRPLQYAALGSMCLLPLMLLIRQFAFAGEGVGATVCLVLSLVLLAIVAVPVVFIALERFSPYNEGANSNASGIAVMLEVARRIGSGEAASEFAADGVMHDEEAARAAGVVPDGATISYERAADASGVANAAEALAEAGASHKPHAASSAPIDTLAAAAAKAAELHEAAEAAEAARREQEEAERLAAELEAQQRALEEEEMRLAAEAAAAKPVHTVPEWYLKATEKARKSEPLSKESESSYRSRYADFPDERRIVEEEVIAEDEPVEICEISGSEEPVPYEEDSNIPEADEQVDATQDDAEQPVCEDGVELAADEQSEETPDSEVEQSAEEVPAPSDEEEQESAEDAAKADDGDVPTDAVEADASATTALAPVEAGTLDLDALRAAAAADDIVQDAEDAADEQPSAVEIAEESDSQEDAPQTVEAAEADSAATSRLPQMMYYKEPEDRSEEMRDRALKERSVVTLTDDEVQDIAVQVEEAQPPASSAQVVSILGDEPPAQEIPADGQVQETPTAQPVEERDSAANSAESTAMLPISPVVPQSMQVPAMPTVAGEGGQPVVARIPVVDLPSITLPSAPIDPKPVAFDDLRQRAPLASVAESDGKQAAKDLLSISLPSIGEPADATGSSVRADASGPQQNTSVSVTGSFAPIGALGVDPVGDELIQDVDPDEVYVDDADDSVFEEEFTETGAFAGPGYVEMPQSRVGRFFGKFRRKKKNKEEEKTAHEWLDVDEDFDARSAGKARGSWESFREEEDDWQGGAFGGERHDEADVEHDHRIRLNAPVVSHDAFAAALAAANAAAEAKGEKPVTDETVCEEDMQQIYSFAAGDINTEVWFVALGSELAGNGGIKAFLAEHASDMRGAVIVNLESLGAGTLSYLEKEGELKQTSCSPRMKRFIRKASQASGIGVAASKLDWRESAASYAQKHRLQAMTVVGMDGNKPAFYGEADDVIENIDPGSLDKSADVIIELLKNI